MQTWRLRLGKPVLLRRGNRLDIMDDALIPAGYMDPIILMESSVRALGAGTILTVSTKLPPKSSLHP